MKGLIVSAVVTVVALVGSLLVGLGSQQPAALAVGVLCIWPLLWGLVGAAIFSARGRYRIVAVEAQQPRRPVQRVQPAPTRTDLVG